LGVAYGEMLKFDMVGLRLKLSWRLETGMLTWKNIDCRLL
jgi:hypothetical protein